MAVSLQVWYWLSHSGEGLVPSFGQKQSWGTFSPLSNVVDHSADGPGVNILPLRGFQSNVGFDFPYHIVCSSQLD